MQLVTKKRQVIAPKTILKGKVIGAKAVPPQKPAKKKIGSVIYGSGKVNLLDIIRSAAGAADLEIVYEQMDIKAKGLLRAIYTAASAIPEAAGKFGLTRTQVLGPDGKPITTPLRNEVEVADGVQQEVSVGFDEVIDPKEETRGYRIQIKAEISGNEALLWIEAYDSRFEYFSEFQTVDPVLFPKVRFFAGPSQSDKRHVYVQFPLTAIAKGEALGINQLVVLAINSATK